MNSQKIKKNKKNVPWLILSVSGVVVVLGAVGSVYLGNFFPLVYVKVNADMVKIQSKIASHNVPAVPELDKVLYDKKMLELANISSSTLNAAISRITGTSTATTSESVIAAARASLLWPVKAVYPNAGAILPFKRIIAYYGNLYSKQMGILGEYPEDEMLARLKDDVHKWEVADPSTPVVPALHYIVVTAQGSAGADGKYRLRMPDSQIDKVIAMAAKVNGIVFLDFQVALSTLPSELPIYEEYLKMPQVHLGIDPEFSMKHSEKPGTVIGTFNSTDVNYATTYLAKLVKDNNLPPKILVVHRFTQAMLTGYKEIKPLPEVQIVVDMDGWGAPAKKIDTYDGFVASEPIQFTGLKLFYKNDIKQTPNRMLTPAELLKLTPRPIYIQYQ